LSPALYQISSTPPTFVMVLSILPELPSITYSLGGNASPSWSAQPTRKLFPGPCTMLVGMQFGIRKLLMTTGPQEAPPHLVSVNLGSISSTVPTVRSPVAFEFVTRKCPVLGLKAEPPIPAKAVAPTQLEAEVDFSAAFLRITSTTTPAASPTGWQYASARAIVISVPAVVPFWTGKLVDNAARNSASAHSLEALGSTAGTIG
jgi:hypothetical protein